MRDQKTMSLIGVCALALLMEPAFGGTTYLFTVSCPNKRLVVEWGVGDVDPGKEFLRVSTGTKYPGCSVTDYNDTLDKPLPRERYSHESGVINGIPLIGPIICHFFGC